MIIDAHIHIWEKVKGRIANKTPVVGMTGGLVRVGDREMLGMPAYLLDGAARAEIVVAEFNAAGVDAGIVVQEPLDGEQNEYAQYATQRFRGRLLAHGLPNYWDIENVAAEAASLLASGFCGLKLPAEHLNGRIRLDDSRLMRIWREMEKTSAVLAVDLAEGEGQVGEMENILSECPKLHVAVGHFGMANRGGWPGQLQLARFENVCLETGGVLWLYRGEGYPFPGALAAIVTAKNEVGIEKLMWGSDWPRTMIDFTYRQSIDFVRNSAALTDSEKALLLGENARRLYRFSEPKMLCRPMPLITED
jgi:L-galactono-1,5-lactonase